MSLQASFYHSFFPPETFNEDFIEVSTMFAADGFGKVSIVSRMKRNRYEPTQLLENPNLISPTCSSSFFTVILFAAQFSNVPCFANSIQIYITVLKYFV